MSRTGDLDRELAGWARDWQAATPALAANAAAVSRLRRRVARRGLALRLILGAEVLLAAAGIAAVFALALRLGRALDLAFAAALSSFFVGLLAYAMWNRRGLWSAAAESTVAYLDLALLRVERRLRTLRWLGWLVAAELALLVPWVASSLRLRGAGRDEYLVLGALAVAVLAATGLGSALGGWYSRRERSRLLALAAELGVSGAEETMAGG